MASGIKSDLVDTLEGQKQKSTYENTRDKLKQKQRKYRNLNVTPVSNNSILLFCFGIKNNNGRDSFLDNNMIN